MLRILFYITTISLCISLIYASDSKDYSNDAMQQTSYAVAGIAIPHLSISSKQCIDSGNTASYSGSTAGPLLKLASGYIDMPLRNTANSCDSSGKLALEDEQKSSAFSEISYSSIGCCIHDGCDNSYKVCRRPRG